MADLWGKIRDNYQVLTAITLLIGIVLITIAEMPNLTWTRVFGAGAISLGAVGLGIYLSGTQPGWYQSFRGRLASAKVPIGIFVLVFVFLPAFLGLGAGFVGLAAGAEGTGWVMLTGIVVLSLMAVAMAAGFLVGARAILAAGEPGSEPGEADDA
ncbi:MAG: hypothetical protein ACOC9Y_06035 [Chloroflexota bacterium]